MRLTKEEFITYMTKLDDSKKYLDKLEEVLGAYLFDGPLYSPIESLEDFIADMCDLKPGCEDLSYFIYELDFGREYKEGCVLDENDTPLDFSSSEKLYDYLCSLTSDKEC